MPGPTITPERRTFAAGPLKLAADVWETGESLGTVVLLHGGGQTRHSWAMTGSRLVRAGWTAIALDLRGHGESSWHPERVYDVEGFKGDLLTVIEQLDGAPVLVGASLGGVMSLLVAAEHPELVRAIVLVDVAISVEPDGVRRIRDFMTAHPDGFESLDEVADAIAEYNPWRRKPRNLDGLRKNVRLGEDGRWRWHWDPVFLDYSFDLSQQNEPSRLRKAAQALTAPVLIVRGVASDVLSQRGLAETLELIPNAQAVEVARTGHMVAGDDNDIFCGELTAFLASIPIG